MMQLIVITPENITEKEGQTINELFNNGLQTLHLRKPFSSEHEISSLINRIAEKYHNRIVLHDHFQLVNSFDLKGVHLNRRNHELPQKNLSSISRSCHSFECLEASKDFNYVFLSPIFNSISKSNYNTEFTHEQLTDAKATGLINETVYALSGVTPLTIPYAAEYGFGGVVVLGSLWGNFEIDGNMTALINRFINLKNICDKQ